MFNKRAVSEVVGALIMITLAVVAGVVVYVYASGLMGPLQGAKVQEPYMEKITMDYYQWIMTTSTSGQVNLVLRNTGVAQLALAVSIQNPCCFIEGQPVQPTFSSQTCSSGNLNVNAPGCSVTLTYSGLSIIQGVAYNVRFVTIDGAIFDFSCIAGATS